MLIPTNDLYLILASRHHAALSTVFTVTVPPWPVLEPLMDKMAARRLATAAGLEAPPNGSRSDRGELADLGGLDFVDQAYVLKIRRWDNGPLMHVPCGGSRKPARTLTSRGPAAR